MNILKKLVAFTVRVKRFVSRKYPKEIPWQFNNYDEKRLPTQKELEEYCDNDRDLKTYFIDKKQKYGQCYEDHTVFGVKCPICGCKKFHVGCGSFFTVCTCSRCGNIVHWHDG